MTTRQEAIDLLNLSHQFPCTVMVKVVGENRDDFVGRVVATITDALNLATELKPRMRETASGRHVAVTVEPEFQSAEEVLSIYEAIRKIDGVVMVM